jgi:hypothetical protein
MLLGQFLQLTIWGVIEPAVTIMAASVPAMRVMLRNMAQNGGAYYMKKRKAMN